MKLSLSDYFSILALLISFLSAVYARRSSNEAKKANEISLNLNKVAIYEEMVSFSDCFRGLFNLPTRERLNQFNKNAVQRSEIYLTPAAHQRLVEIFKYCCENQIWLEIAENVGGSQGNKSGELEVRKKYKEVLSLLYPAIEKIKNEAKINNA